MRMDFALPAVALTAALAFIAHPAGPVAAQDDGEARTAAPSSGATTLLEGLGAETATDRQAAEDALVAMGENVRPLVEPLLGATDAEVRSRARSIIRRLDDVARSATQASLTWAGLRGNPARSGIAGGQIPAAQPEAAWRVRVHGVKLIQGAVIPGDESIVCLSGDGIVRSYATKDGARRWLANVESDVTASAVLAAGRLVVPTTSGLVALDSETGRRVWHVPADYGCDAAPALDGGRVFAAFKNLGVRAFDLMTGEQLFHAPMAPSGALLVDGSLIIAGTEDGQLVRLHPETGKPIWTIEIGSAPNMGPTLAGPGMIAVLARDRYLRVIGAQRGKTLWERRLPSASKSESLVSAAGRLFLTDDGGSLRCFEAGTGRALWNRNEGMIEMGGPCATSQRVMWGTRGRLTCRSASSGVLQWRIDIEAIDDAVPVIHDGTIYFLTNMELIALR